MRYLFLINLLFLPSITLAAVYLDPIEEAGCAVEVSQDNGDKFKIEQVKVLRSYYSVSNCESDLAEDGLGLGESITLRNLSNKYKVYQIPFSIELSGDDNNPNASVHFYTEGAEPKADLASSELTNTIAVDSTNAVIRIQTLTQMVTVLQKLLSLYAELHSYR